MMSNRGDDKTARFQLRQNITINAIFGTYFGVIESRRKEGMSKADLCVELDKDKAQISKLTNSPTNMKISTMSDLAEALDCDIEFALIDRKHPGCIYTLYGKIETGEFVNSATFGDTSGSSLFINFVSNKYSSHFNTLPGAYGKGSDGRQFVTQDRQEVAIDNYAG